MTVPEIANFKEYDLDRSLTRALSINGFRSPTPIQEAVIGDILAGKDVIGCARTGSGKSLAFMLPVTQLLLKPAERDVRGPRCIIMSPTRELAHQLHKKLKELLTFTNLRCELMSNASDLKEQEKYLKKPVDFLIATPGRLIDHTQNGTVNYSRLEVLILDEADRMLDMGFRDDLNYIIEQCPEDRQTLLFSATLDHPDTLDVARSVMSAPIEHIIDTVDQPLDNIQEHFYRLKGIIQKFDLLTHLIKEQPKLKNIVFITSRAAVEQLSARLTEQGLEVVSLHGKMAKTARDEAMLKFKSLAQGTLVTTDLGARGLDVLDVTRVINFDMPTKPEDYVHRIGRTGRLERKGTAISFVSSGKDTEALNAIRDYLDRYIPLDNDPLAPVQKGKPNNRNHSKKPPSKPKRGNFKGNADGMAPLKRKK
ncbi:DEAD/DEAH box helicase [Litoribrevibacter euphylliae]|uniref:DEAD/DEAH box helicase n=1 Tax=Litoribrevibacter euphylliae TaxID=1834034 RepID=A0ABV7HA41_9GAMM